MADTPRMVTVSADDRSPCAHNFASLLTSYTFGTDGPRLPPIRVRLTCDWCDESWDYAAALASVPEEHPEPECSTHEWRIEGDDEIEAFHAVCELCGFDQGDEGPEEPSDG